MIGFYNYTVVLTYVGLLSSVLGMALTFNGKFMLAMFCLLISGTCDMFDGVVARSCKTRSEHAKSFGIQIDSLCDLICFAAFPAIFAYHYTITECPTDNEWFIYVSFVISFMFVLCGVIRLAYFNVMEIERQKETSEVRKYYQGLPVTSIAGFLPLVYVLRVVIPSDIYYIVLNVFMALIAFLFVFDFKMPKPHKKGIIIMSLMGLCLIVVMSIQLCGGCR